MRTDRRAQLAVEILQGYADRGVFRGFSRAPAPAGLAAFSVIWHRGRQFEFLVDTRRNTIRCPAVLPEVPANSAMYRQFRLFLKSRQGADVPDHRRIAPARARILAANRGGNVSVSLRLPDGDFDYGVRKFVHLLNEVYMVFLQEYFDYQVEVFELDPDQPIPS